MPLFCDGWEALVFTFSFFGLRASRFDFCPLDIGFPIGAECPGCTLRPLFQITAHFPTRQKSALSSPMSKHDTSLPPATSQTAQRHDGWTLAKQAAFLRQLSATHSVTEAAKSVLMSRQSAYRLRSKLKGQAFDLAWEVAFHHSYDVLAHTALDRALNGTEMPVFFQGEQIGSYRKYDERLTVAMMRMMTHGGNPAMGRLGPSAEKHARDFEALLGKLESGEAVETGAATPDQPGELETLRRFVAGERTDEGAVSCPSALSDDELIAAIQEVEKDEGK